MSDFAARVRMLRAKRKWTYRDAGGAAGLSASLIHRYEKRGAFPTLANLRRLAKAYGVSESWLLGTKKTARPDGWTREFTLERVEDVSGVSGTGTVAVGVVLPTGRCIIEWLPSLVNVRSIVVYQSLDEVDEVHGHGGATSIVFRGEETKR